MVKSGLTPRTAPRLWGFSRLAAVGGAVVALASVANLVKTSAVTSAIRVDLSLLAVALLVCCVFIGFDVTARKNSVGGWLAGLTFAAFAASSLLSVRNSSHAYTKNVQLFVLCVLLFAGARTLIRSESSRAALVRTLLIIGSVTSLAILVLGTLKQGRTTVGGGDPISLGRVCGLASVIFIAYALYSANRRRVWCLVGALASLYATLLTGSRGPALVTAIAIISIFLRTGRQSRLLKSISVVALIFFAISAFAESSSTSPIARIFGEGASASDTQRSALVSGTWQLIANHPRGIGLGNLVLYLQPGAIVPSQGANQYPHNVLLEAAVEGGWISATLLTMLIVYSFRRALADATGVVGSAILGCWVVGIGSAMTSSDLTGNRLMWVMLGVSLATPRLVRKMTVPKIVTDRPRLARSQSSLRFAAHQSTVRPPKLKVDEEPDPPALPFSQ